MLRDLKDTRTNWLTVGLVAQILERLMVDVFVEEVNATVSQGEVHSAWMRRLETKLCIPVARSVAMIGGLGLAAIVVERNDRRHQSVAIVRVKPTVPRVH